ncbi:MAG: Mur ligase domain-containing protein, partial [Cyclobacteriaceae bacterium]|nr:Mur ligase domain-containing protein [Cyclobacteriaceae bacterium]
MSWNNYHRIYFIGIGGIGMSALARYFYAMGLEVAGYDRTETSLTTQLQLEGMSIHFEDNLELVPSQVLQDNKGSLIVYTPAVPADHKELNFFREANYTVLKRSEV